SPRGRREGGRLALTGRRQGNWLRLLAPGAAPSAQGPPPVLCARWGRAGVKAARAAGTRIAPLVNRFSRGPEHGRDQQNQDDDERRALGSSDLLPAAGKLAERLPLELVVKPRRRSGHGGPEAFPEPVSCAALAHRKCSW